MRVGERERERESKSELQAGLGFGVWGFRFSVLGFFRV